MDYYLKELEELTKDFHDVMHDYPLFSEMLDDIYDKDVKEINELLEKNDEYYLKEALDKLKKLINYVKTTSESIQKEYDKFDQYAKTWEKERVLNVSEQTLQKINDNIHKANNLITSHELKDLIEANKIMEDILKQIK